MHKDADHVIDGIAVSDDQFQSIAKSYKFGLLNRGDNYSRNTGMPNLGATAGKYVFHWSAAYKHKRL